MVLSCIGMMLLALHWIAMAVFISAPLVTDQMTDLSATAIAASQSLLQ